MTKEKSRYSDAELEMFKALIEEKLSRAKGKLNSYKQQLTDSNQDFKIKAIDDYTESAEADQLSEMVTREEKYIFHLENALIRIKNKVYGVCRVTGQLISKERLMAVPHATLSIEAKQASSST